MMSGTSLDGLDLCLAEFHESHEGWKFRILGAETISYAPKQKKELQNAEGLSVHAHHELHSRYGKWLGEQAVSFLNKYSKINVHYIASHGHTVCHRPDLGYSTQIGCGIHLAHTCGIPVVYDFRTQDVVLGGQGAPLVPFGDRYLFGKYDACLNLGGFSNISFEKGNERLAFDICPVNLVFNALAQQLGKEYDEGGNIAKDGALNPALLAQLNRLSYYAASPPKSLGKEWVDQEIFPLLKNIEVSDALRTFSEHTADQITSTAEMYGLENILITGGGAKNTFLLELLKQKNRNLFWEVPADDIIDHKEALIFAFLGLQKLLGRPNVIPSSTGAKKAHSTGVLITP